MSYLEIEAACQTMQCGAVSRQTCDVCSNPTCEGHLYQTGEMLTFQTSPETNEWYEDEPTWSRKEVQCLECFLKTQGHSPAAIWQETGQESTLTLDIDPIERGTWAQAGDYHAFVSPPEPAKVLSLRWGPHTIALNVFQTVAMLDFLRANEFGLREMAQQASAKLVPWHQASTRAAKRTDAGLGRMGDGYDD